MHARVRKDPRGNKLPFLAVRRKPSGAAKPEGLRPTASFNPVIYFRAAPKCLRDKEGQRFFRRRIVNTLRTESRSLTLSTEALTDSQPDRS